MQRIPKRYYCIDRGHWFTADHPEGSWGPAKRIPVEVRRVPARLGWAVDYESNDYSISLDPYYGHIRYKDKSKDVKRGKNWTSNTSKFPE